MESIVVKYLKHLNIPISKKYCQKIILSHPYYPSLLSIADTLKRLGIDYQVGQLETRNIDQLPFPCITHLDKDGGQLVFLKDQNDLDNQSDLEAWDGVVLKAETTNTITDEEHNKQYARENNQRKLSVVLAFTLLGLLAVPVLQVASWLYLSLFATSVVGTLVGYLLLAKDLGVTYKPVENFCNAGKRTNCDHILNAGDAQLFGNLTFTDAAASYFFFQLLIVVLFIPLFEGTESFLSVLAIASVLTIPVIGYSLYYQAVKANTWCRLCVVVDVILGMQAGLFALMYAGQMLDLTSVQFVPVLTSALLFAAVTSSVLLLKNRLKPAEQLRNEVIAATRIKHNPKIFKYLLTNGKQININSFNREITIGNSNVPLKIHIAARLGCDPCKRGYWGALNLLSVFPDLIQLNMRFHFLRSDEHDARPPSEDKSLYLIWYWNKYIYGRKNQSELTKIFLMDWYKSMDIEGFIRKNPKGANYRVNDKIRDIAAQHTTWFEQSKINSTPSFFINGYKLPHNYKIKDLIPLIPDLVNLFKSNKFKSAIS